MLQYDLNHKRLYSYIHVLRNDLSWFGTGTKKWRGILNEQIYYHSFI